MQSELHKYRLDLVIALDLAASALARARHARGTVVITRHGPRGFPAIENSSYTVQTLSRSRGDLKRRWTAPSSAAPNGGSGAAQSLTDSNTSRMKVHLCMWHTNDGATHRREVHVSQTTHGLRRRLSRVLVAGGHTLNNSRLLRDASSKEARVLVPASLGAKERYGATTRQK